MKITREGIDIIKKYEGFSAKPYFCPAGKNTIGYGHVIRLGEQITEITKERGEELLRSDLAEAEKAIKKRVSVPLNDNQYSALCSLVFNLGSKPLIMTLGKRLNQGDYLGCAEEFPRWCYANGKPMKGLKRRRNEERMLFLKPVLVAHHEK